MLDYCPYCTSDNIEFFNGDCQCLHCKECWNTDEEDENE